MDDDDRTDKSAGGSELPRRADPGGAATGAKRSGAVIALALLAIVVMLVLFGLMTDVI